MNSKGISYKTELREKIIAYIKENQPCTFIVRKPTENTSQYAKKDHEKILTYLSRDNNGYMLYSDKEIKNALEDLLYEKVLTRERKSHGQCNWCYWWSISKEEVPVEDLNKELDTVFGKIDDEKVWKDNIEYAKRYDDCQEETLCKADEEMLNMGQVIRNIGIKHGMIAKTDYDPKPINSEEEIKQKEGYIPRNPSDDEFLIDVVITEYRQEFEKRLKQAISDRDDKSDKILQELLKERDEWQDRYNDSEYNLQQARECISSMELDKQRLTNQLNTSNANVDRLVSERNRLQAEIKQYTSKNIQNRARQGINRELNRMFQTIVGDEIKLVIDGNGKSVVIKNGKENKNDR